MELNGLKEILNKRNLSQKEVCIKAGISPEQMCRYLHNKVTPTYATLEKIAQVLKVSVDKLTK